MGKKKERYWHNLEHLLELLEVYPVYAEELLKLNGLLYQKEATNGK